MDVSERRPCLCRYAGISLVSAGALVESSAVHLYIFGSLRLLGFIFALTLTPRVEECVQVVFRFEVAFAQ